MCLVRLGNPPFLCPTPISKACDLKSTWRGQGEVLEDFEQAFFEDLLIFQLREINKS